MILRNNTAPISILPLRRLGNLCPLHDLAGKIFTPAFKICFSLPFKFLFGLVWIGLYPISSYVFAAPAPALPGIEISGTEPMIPPSSSDTLSPLKNPSYFYTLDSGWIAPGIAEQLGRDKTLIPMGMGALFVPAYTEPRVEPLLLIYQNKKEIVSAPTGKRILLEPGQYQVRLGSGDRTQKMNYDIEVTEGHTTVLPTFWSGLQVETLDESGEYISEEYEIVRLDDREFFGKGYGEEAERLGDLRTWILKPGIYRISKIGEDISSNINYLTVQLNPGALTQLELVFENKEPFRLISGGQKGWGTRNVGKSHWRYNLRVAGNLSYTDKKGGTDRQANLSVMTDVRSSALFDNVHYLGINDLRITNIFERKGSDFFGIISGKEGSFTPTTDNIHLRSTWVRRLNPWLGPYLRSRLYSNLLPRNFTIDSVAYLVDDIGSNTPDTLEVLGGKSIELQSSFANTAISIGSGVNLEVIKSYPLQVSLQNGFAVKQTYTRDIYIADGNSLSKKEGRSLQELGWESSMNLRMRLGTRLTVDILGDVFFKNGKPNLYEIEDFTSDVRFNLTRNLEISYLFEIEDLIKESSRNDPNRFSYNQGFFLRLSFYL